MREVNSGMFNTGCFGVETDSVGIVCVEVGIGGAG